MSNVPIPTGPDLTAPTPQNTPLNTAPIQAGLSRPTVPDISEDAEPEEGAESGAAIQEAMLGMVQGKLATLVGKSSGYVESLPDEVKISVEALKGVQVKQNELQNRYKHECLELEKKVYIVINIAIWLDLMDCRAVPGAGQAPLRPSSRAHHRCRAAD